jgi:octaheme c-type cytochrome (tetrathionate reductase family)
MTARNRCNSLVMATLSALLISAPGAPVVAQESTADHGKFEELQRSFDSGPEVTRACLQCHTEAASQIHRTKHWTWEFINPATDQKLGKKHVLNNFCISIPANTPFCTSCHVGYGWKDDSFDFTSDENIDCLVCHDTSGNYRKPPGMAGLPAAHDMEFPPGSGKIVKGIDLGAIARQVGRTSRDTCGACHFFGGGGDGVKHGDMDSSLAAPSRALDVHMDALGLDFTCASCHKGSSHDVAGSRYAPTARDTAGALMRGRESDAERNPATCVACHDNRPHATHAALDRHTDRIACQTCHIPAIARGGVATKLTWDWKTSGQLDENGKPFVKKDAKGHVIYDSRKGDFTLGENVIPEYRWFNGDVTYTLLDDKIEPGDAVTPINRLGGSPTDGRSMIWPMKVFRGQQPYDTVNRTLVTPHTAGGGDKAYWANFGWEKAIASGMQAAGAPFSGQVGFVHTEMAWPITHMVAPKENALACTDCHQSAGRLAGIEGVYIPARDRHPVIDTAGWSLALLALVGVGGHGAMRLLSRRKS